MRIATILKPWKPCHVGYHFARNLERNTNMGYKHSFHLQILLLKLKFCQLNSYGVRILPDGHKLLIKGWYFRQKMQWILKNVPASKIWGYTRRDYNCRFIHLCSLPTSCWVNHLLCRPCQSQLQLQGQTEKLFLCRTTHPALLAFT